VDVVADRLRTGLTLFRGKFGAPTALVAAGGVAANQAIRKILHRLAFECGTVLVVPPPELCTDNGAIDRFGREFERLALGLVDTLEFAPLPRWPLETVARRCAVNILNGQSNDLRAHHGCWEREAGGRAGRMPRFAPDATLCVGPAMRRPRRR